MIGSKLLLFLVNSQDLSIDQCEVKILMQQAAKPDHGWLDSNGQQLMGTFSSSSGSGDNQRTHSYTAPTGPPLGYNVILIGGPAPGSSPGCQKALVWPPNSPSQVAGPATQASAPQPQDMGDVVVVDAQPAEQGVPTTTGVADELRKLHDLHDQGVLTDAEFAQAKSKILDGQQP